MFSWDGDDHLRSVINRVDTWLGATYDGSGTRVSKSDLWTGTHNYSWGPGGILADSSGTTTFTPGLAQRQGSTDRFYHSDWLGSSRYLTDGTGNGYQSALRFDAYGGRSATDSPATYDPTEFQFAGSFGYQTEYAAGTEPGLGLQLPGQRYYDPLVGRFISQDPIRFMGGLNLYGYCGNDAVNREDSPDLDWLLSVRAETGHAWIYEKDLSTGEAHTYGRWALGYGGPGGSGVCADTELRPYPRPFDVERSRILESRPKIPINNGYNAIDNNCVTYATDTRVRHSIGRCGASGMIPAFS